MTTTERRRNNLDLVRLLAALLVIVSHSYPVVGLEEPPAWLDPSGKAWGHFGILVFFSISGYLIAQSWERSPRAGRYWLKRALRILPGLAVATSATAWVLGPVVTSVSLRMYFTDPSTWLYPLVKTSMLIPGNVDPPGLFLDQPSQEINASLWTLPIEVACYAGLVILAKTRLLRISTLGVLVVGAALVGNDRLLELARPGVTAGVVEFLAGVLILAAAFFTGSLLYLLRDRIQLRPSIAAGVLALALLLGQTPLGPTAAALVMPYVILTVGLALPVVPTGILRRWDLSYGTYVFAFPVQQTVRYYTDSGSPWVITGLTLLIVLPLAAASWVLVESRALALAHRRRQSATARYRTPNHGEATDVDEWVA